MAKVAFDPLSHMTAASVWTLGAKGAFIKDFCTEGDGWGLVQKQMIVSIRLLDTEEGAQIPNIRSTDVINGSPLMDGMMAIKEQRDRWPQGRFMEGGRWVARPARRMKCFCCLFRRLLGKLYVTFAIGGDRGTPRAQQR